MCFIGLVLSSRIYLDEGVRTTKYSYIY